MQLRLREQRSSFNLIHSKTRMMANPALATQSLQQIKQVRRSITRQWRYRFKLAQRHRSSLHISQSTTLRWASILN